jgi:hypothetical protein
MIYVYCTYINICNSSTLARCNVHSRTCGETIKAQLHTSNCSETLVDSQTASCKTFPVFNMLSWDGEG